jgi:hypothetical protein
MALNLQPVTLSMTGRMSEITPRDLVDEAGSRESEMRTVWASLIVTQGTT